ncbi:uncharacterized protein LOC120847056 [Ixodes scapularis]|uniref:uncharacterized protein LOC120847056 n=1 Tax=Ixodes scapularis TaxID=6945 RepID=UPI001A9DF55D|nr:uncharacterized protein LOC120847056 [Ixodes scapularis]
MLGLAEQRELAPKRSSLTNLDYLTTNRSHQDPTNLGAMLRSSYYAWGFRGSSHYASGYRRSSRQRRRRTEGFAAMSASVCVCTCAICVWTCFTAVNAARTLQGHLNR